MNKEELFRELSLTYKNYLCGSSTYNDVYEVIEKINSTVHSEVKDLEDIETFVKDNNKRIDDTMREVRVDYNKNIVNPLVEELLDFLQFEGLVKSTQYKKRAEELKEKLQECDGIFWVRERALMQFFETKIGSKYDEKSKIKLALMLGALDTKNLVS